MTNQHRLLLGVDAGNTKAIALLARADGSIVGAGRAWGPSDIHAVGVNEAVARLIETVAGAQDAAGSQRADPVRITAVFGLAGADWPEDVAALEDALRPYWPDVAVVNDAVGALRASVPEGPGVVVVCGTGATTAARGVDGRVWHSSFWQEPQGAQELGVRALQAVLRAELGIHPPTSLTPRLLGATGEPSVEALLHRMTSRERRVRFGHAAFAPLLLDAAEAGDPSAVEIVTEHGQALGRMALAAARRVGIEQVPFTLALTGGVFRHRGTIHRDAVLSEVASRAPGTTVIDAALEPAVGALLLAFDRAAIEVGDAVLGRLRATLPPSGLFATLPIGGVAQG